MLKTMKFVLAAATVAILVGCGGGGSSGGGGSTADNPLVKYNGTYYHCDKNARTTVVMTPTGSNGLNVTVSNDVYSGVNCTGSVIGAYRWNSPALITYTGRTSATLPAVTVLPFSDTVDTVTLNTSSMTGTLTGSAVSGSCVNYSYVDGGSTITGRHCYSLVMQASSSSGALYLSSDNQYLVQFALINGTLQAQEMDSRNSTFNYINLVRD